MSNLTVDFLQTGSGAVARPLDVKISEIAVSVTDFGAVGDGVTDDAEAFQAAHDSLTTGGTIFVPRSDDAYRVSHVSITNRNITIRLEAGTTVKRHGDAGIGPGDAYRGMFYVGDLIDSGFHLDLDGGTIDLNGQGPIGIGVAGRIANTYHWLTVPTVPCINGPANEAVYSKFSTGGRISGPGMIKNSGGSGVLLRNSSFWTVEGVSFENIANWGIEESYAPAADVGGGTMPATLGAHSFRHNDFADINDRPGYRNAADWRRRRRRADDRSCEEQ